MEWCRLALEYLKVLLTPQIVIIIGVIWFAKTFKENIAALIDRIKAIKFPGGELSTPQHEKLKNESPIEDKTSPEPQSADLPANIKENDIETLKTLYNAERSRAYFWEYSYLNYYLVTRTQYTLDWLAKYAQPMPVSLYDTLTSPSVPDPKERNAILNALENHYLVQVKDNIITVSQKGHEYIEWRSKVHQSPSNNFLS